MLNVLAVMSGFKNFDLKCFADGFETVISHSLTFSLPVELASPFHDFVLSGAE